MKISNKTYDRMKWVALIFIPAFETLILTVGKIWSIPYYLEIGATIAAIGLFLGSLLGVSSYNYYDNKGGNDDGSEEECEDSTGEDY